MPLAIVLNDRQQAFALHRALGLSQVKAYRLAYPNAVNASGISASACQLEKIPAIKQLILKWQDEMVVRLANVGILDRNWVLDNLRLIVSTGKNEASRVRALELIGKELGLFVDRSEVTRVDATQELDPTRLTWDELQTLLTLQRKARRPAPLAGQVVDTRALPADEDEPAETLSSEPQD